MPSSTRMDLITGEDRARLELIRDHDGNDLSPNDKALLSKLIDSSDHPQEPSSEQLAVSAEGKPVVSRQIARAAAEVFHATDHGVDSRLEAALEVACRLTGEQALAVIGRVYEEMSPSIPSGPAQLQGAVKAALATQPVETQQGEEECERCGGTGKCERTTLTRPPQFHLGPCEACNGTGREPPQHPIQEERSGGQVDERNRQARIG